jgi:hypothetical protein
MVVFSQLTNQQLIGGTMLCGSVERLIQGANTIWRKQRTCHWPLPTLITQKEKQPKPKNQTIPKPKVWCANLYHHTHTKIA